MLWKRGIGSDDNTDNETVLEETPTAQLRSLVAQRANSGVASTLAASARVKLTNMQTKQSYKFYTNTKPGKQYGY
jgi:hypothetical protein